MAHELSHHLLEHHFDSVVLGEDRARQFDEQQEKEAKFLSGELLVPQAAAFRMAYDKWSNEQVAANYGVSVQFGPPVRATRAEAKLSQRRVTG